MELPQADGKLICASGIENMKMLLSILKGRSRSAPKAFGALARRRLSRPINRGTIRRRSVQVVLPMLVIHHKAENASAHSTSKTMEGLPLWANME